MSVQNLLQQLFDGERAALRAEDALLQKKAGELLPVLRAATEEALGMRDVEEGVLRLRRLVVLLGEVEGAEATDLLLRALGHDDERVRMVALDEIEHRAYDRYAEVARAIDRLLDSGVSTPALLELPHLVADIGEPSALLLIRRFLQHGDPEVVAEGIAAIVELGDPEGAKALAKLRSDTRVVMVADDDDEESQATLGQLAQEALEAIEANG